MVTSLVRIMSFDEILNITPGTRVVLRNNESRHPNYPLHKHNVGEVFVIQNVYIHDTLIYPAIVVKGLSNPYEPIGGGFCSSRFGLYKNPKLYNVGGNV